MKAKVKKSPQKNNSEQTAFQKQYAGCSLKEIYYYESLQEYNLINKNERNQEDEFQQS